MLVIRRILFFSLALTLLIMLGACSHVQKESWPDGKLKSQIPYNRQGKIEGEATWWYENGNKMLQAAYLNDTLNGISMRYHPNGIKQSQENYVMGKLNGPSTEWDARGNLVTRENYVNDTLEGEVTQWYDSGKRQVEGHYLHGKFEGRWLYFDQLENLIGEGIFRQGNGSIRSWNDEGKVIRTAEYKDNEKNGKEIWYDNKGNKIKEIIYEHGEQLSEQDFPGDSLP